jgi:tRNA nucleotidyltransferase (CCA-adding enzyme)
MERRLAQVIRSVTPSRAEAERLKKIAEKIHTKTLIAAKKYSEVVEVVLGGSYARGTWLPSEGDIDLFVKISPSTPADKFEKLGLEIGSEATHGYPRGKKFAQHPYTEAIVEGVRVNIVPCYDVQKGQWKSAADRSPYHLQLMQESLTPRMRQEVRLLKKFMKVIGVYGAEIQRQGFSGYVAEVLVLRERAFEKVMEYFAKLSLGEGRSFKILDPVDSNRNLASAISSENVGKMILASRTYLESHSSKFFKGIAIKKNRRVESILIALIFEHTHRSDDILWGELKRTLRRLVLHVEQEGFKIARAVASSNGERESALILLPEFDRLPKHLVRDGPRIELASESERFIKKNSSKAILFWVGSDLRLHLLQARRFVSLSSLLSTAVKGGILNFGASPKIASAIRRTGRIASGRPLLKVAKGKPWLQKGINELASNTIGTY